MENFISSLLINDRRKVVLLFLCFLLAGCGKISSNPKTVASDYLDSYLHGRYEKSYQYISTKDKSVKNLQEYLLEYEGIDGFQKGFLEKISYEIKKVEIDKDTAKVQTEVTSPNFVAMVGDFMSAAFLTAFGGGDEKTTEKMLEDKYKDKDVPMITTERFIDLVKEPDGWKVFLNLEQQKKIEELKTQAEQLEKDKKLKAAKEKYNEVLRLDSKEVLALGKIGELDKEIENFEEKQAYVNNVVLYDFEAKYHQTYLYEKVAGVNFKIKNNGDKTLSKVEVTVYFKDAAGVVIAEEDYYPVIATSFSFSDTKPLKPNYVWQMEQGKFYPAESVPSEWAESNATAKITDIEFQE